MSSDFLAEMAAASSQRVALAKRTLSLVDLRALAADQAPARVPELAEFAIIAEVKLRSPAQGALTSELSMVDRAQVYAKAGAAMISVLTEPERFDGHLDHLREVAAAVPLPVMRKDFLVDPYQIVEARAAGASAVLLIASLFDKDHLQEMLGTASDCGLFVLLEVFAVEEIDALRPMLGDGVMLGANCRDLRSLEIDPTRFRSFAKHLQGQPCVAESGMFNAEDLAMVAGLGFSAALVGTALMRAANPEELIKTMLQAAREKRCQSPSRSVD